MQVIDNKNKVPYNSTLSWTIEQISEVLGEPILIPVASGGTKCVWFYKREDGTITTIHRPSTIV